MTTKAEELRAEAAQHEQDAADSFERCDTDGFLSQWASGINARLDRLRADVVEAGGIGTFAKDVLVTLDGEETDARLVKTRYGLRWRLDSTDEWLGHRPARESTLASKGYREVEVYEVAPARADTWAPAGATGLSGATSVSVGVFRDDVRKGEQALWRLVALGDCKAECEEAE